MVSWSMCLTTIAMHVVITNWLQQYITRNIGKCANLVSCYHFLPQAFRIVTPMNAEAVYICIRDPRHRFTDIVRESPSFIFQRFSLFSHHSLKDKLVTFQFLLHFFPNNCLITINLHQIPYIWWLTALKRLDKGYFKSRIENRFADLVFHIVYDACLVCKAYHTVDSRCRSYLTSSIQLHTLTSNKPQ